MHHPQSRIRDLRPISRGKFDRLPCSAAESTTGAFDGCGLRGRELARPAPYASHPVLVHRLVRLLHASFRPRLTATPLRFANPSPPSGWIEDFHLQAVEHARHTEKTRTAKAALRATNYDKQKKGAPAPQTGVSCEAVESQNGNSSQESQERTSIVKERGLDTRMVRMLFRSLRHSLHYGDSPVDWGAGVCTDIYLFDRWWI